MKKLIGLFIGLLLMGTAYSATMTITIPNEVVGDVIEAFATEFQYPTSVPDPICTGEEDCEYISNPMSKATFAKQEIRRFIREIYIDHMRDIAISEAQTTSVITAEGEVTDVTVE